MINTKTSIKRTNLINNNIQKNINMMKPQPLETIEMNKVELKKWKKYNILSYNKSKLYLRLKNVECPFGVSDYNGNKKFAMNVSITPEIEKQLDLLQDKLIEDIIGNKDLNRELKLKRITKESLEYAFNNLYRESTNDKYLSTMKVNFVKDYDHEGRIKTTLYEGNKLVGQSHDEHTLINAVGKFASVDLVLNPTFYNISGKTIGVSMKAYALKVNDKVSKKPEVVFNFDDEDDGVSRLLDETTLEIYGDDEIDAIDYV